MRKRPRTATLGARSNARHIPPRYMPFLVTGLLSVGEDNRCVSVERVHPSSVLAPTRPAALRGIAVPGVRRRRTPTPARRQCSPTCGTLAHRRCAPQRRRSNVRCTPAPVYAFPTSAPPTSAPPAPSGSPRATSTSSLLVKSLLRHATRHGALGDLGAHIRRRGPRHLRFRHFSAALLQGQFIWRPIRPDEGWLRRLRATNQERRYHQWQEPGDKPDMSHGSLRCRAPERRVTAPPRLLPSPRA
jgi:hypothetical protein